jgi:hypothetical protein
LAKTKSAPQSGAFFMRPQVLDLFGEVPVTQGDVDAWLMAVPRIPPDSPRAAYYVQAWCVVDKIKRAKLEGWFEHAVEPKRPGAGLWWERFNWARPK